MEWAMKKSKLSEAQFALVVKQAKDRTTIGEVCRKARISDATFFGWRKKYAGLMPSEMRRLRQLEDENSKLKRLAADQSVARGPRSNREMSQIASKAIGTRNNAGELYETPRS